MCVSRICKELVQLNNKKTTKIFEQILYQGRHLNVWWVPTKILWETPLLAVNGQVVVVG